MRIFKMMHVSIWHQFSSNHSADFTIVGTFQTPDDAQTAAADLLHILTTISAWYRDHKRTLSGSHLVPCPPELHFAQHYNIDWGDHGIDWITAGREPESIHTFDTLVIVENIGGTYTGVSPFDRLLRRMGASIVYEQENLDLALYVNVTCIAPNASTAERLVSLAQAALTEEDRTKAMPGIDYLGDGIFERDGQRVSFRDLWHPTLHVELPRMIAYLEDQGCTDITYEVVAK
jgi:hypothetical protein